jgi:hypothetical protein
MRIRLSLGLPFAFAVLFIACTGPTGPSGEAGEAGPRGATGKTGATGPQSDAEVGMLPTAESVSPSRA